MPNHHGFDELPNRGHVVRRCVWCHITAPSRDSELFMSVHHRHHRRLIQEALDASKAEMLVVQEAIAD